MPPARLSAEYFDDWYAGKGAGLRDAGFADVDVRDRPAWLARERGLWEEAVTIDPGGDPGLLSFRDEAIRSLGRIGLIYRVLATATAPGKALDTASDGIG